MAGNFVHAIQRNLWVFTIGSERGPAKLVKMIIKYLPLFVFLQGKKKHLC